MPDPATRIRQVLAPATSRTPTDGPPCKRPLHVLVIDIVVVILVNMAATMRIVSYPL
jgi:hypothetical protein